MHKSYLLLRRCLRTAGCIALLLLSGTAGLRAQSIPQEVKDQLARIQASYQQRSNLSFDLAYTYALEGEPAAYLDSLSGVYHLNGNNYYGRLGQIEYVQDSAYNLTVYASEKMITLGKAGSTGNQRMNEFLAWDSILAAGNLASATLENRSEDSAVIRFRFNPGTSYQQSSINFSRKTHLIHSVSYWTVQPTIGSPADSAIQDSVSKVVVRIAFSHYREEEEEDKLFDHSRFIRKENNEWRLQDAYKDYQLIISSPDL